MPVTSDKILLTAAAALGIASAGVFGTMAWRAGVAGAPVPPVELSEAPYTPSGVDAPPIKTEVWAAPPAQSRGREWVYDTFTPPEIFYNGRTKQFTVRPPSSLVDEDAIETEFGLELVSVRPEPFRLQLIGFVGEGESARGTFENVVTGEVFLGGPGRHVPKLGVTIRSLDIRREEIALPQSMTTKQRVATAVVRDEKNGREITLTNRERQFTGTVAALVAATGATATREVQAGDVFQLGAASYRVEKVQLTPPAIEVTKQLPNSPHPDRRVLTPREGETGEAPENGG